MPTKRTPTGRPPHATITREAVELFVRALELQDSYGNSYCSELIEIRNRLDRLLHLPPWEESLMDADDDAPPEWMKDPHRLESYRRSRALYLALEAAADEADA
jgi:hypothetical protein